MAGRGRFAPSPTGDLHLGGARTALGAWLLARSQGASFVLRMEDLDGPRVVPGAAARILEDLVALGLDWDEGPDRGGPGRAPDDYVQSRGGRRYQQAIDELTARGLAYPCWCSRAEIARAASAPHAGEEGPRYPGTCRDPEERARRAARDPARAPAIRFRVEPGLVEVDDRVAGRRAFEPERECGDFVIRRSDGLFAYQLAVAVDDAHHGVEEVVRGDDLLPSTARQLLVLRALGRRAPTSFAHLPLLLGPDGQRLAKRHGAISVRALLAAGRTPAQVVGALYASLMEVDADEAAALHTQGASPARLLEGFSLARVRRSAERLDPSSLPLPPR